MTDAKPLTEAEIERWERDCAMATCEECVMGEIEYDDMARALVTIRERDATLAMYRGRHEAQAAIISEQEARIAALAEALDEAAAALAAWTRWEGAVICDTRAWGGGLAEYPTLVEPHWARMIEIQTQRNAALAKISAARAVR